MDEFADVNEHSPQNITLLCPTHHQEKTSNRLPKSIIKTANANPFNADKAHTHPHDWFFGNSIVDFNIGGNYFTSNLHRDGNFFDAINFGGESVAGFFHRDRRLVLNLMFRDILLNPIFVVRESEVTFSTSNMDVSVEGQTIKIRPPFNFDPIHILKRDDGIDILRGTFVKPGASLSVTPHAVVMNPGHNTFVGNRMFHCKIGLCIR